MILYQDCSSHLDLSQNMAARWRGLFSLYIYIETFKKSSCHKPLDRFPYNFAENVPLVILYQDCLSHLDLSKNKAARGRGLFSLYICIESFRNPLVRNHWTDFHIILQKCSFGDPVARLFKPFGFVKKHGRQGAGLIFPIYLYRNLLKNHWTDFSIILQKCSFGDPVPRLFKPFGFVKKHGRQLAELIFPI